MYLPPQKKALRPRCLRELLREASMYSGSHISTAKTAPHVPGATGRNPKPNDVAISFGKRGNPFALLIVCISHYRISFLQNVP